MSAFLRKTVCLLLIVLMTVTGCKKPYEPEVRQNDDFIYQIEEDGSATIIQAFFDNDAVFVPEDIEGHPVKTIKTDAYNCMEVLLIYVPESVEVIEKNSFLNCLTVRELTISANCQAKEGFDQLDNLQIINITEGNGKMTEYAEREDVPWRNSRTSVKYINLEEGITNIADYSFEGFINVHRITIPSTVTSIGRYAMYNMINLHDLALPFGLKQLKEGALGSDNFELISLEEVIIPKNTTEIGEDALDPSRRYYLYADSPAKEVLDKYGNTTVMDYSFGESQLAMEVAEGKQLSFVKVPDFIAAASQFTSSDDTVVSVSPDGYIRALKMGQAVITASSETGNTSLEVTVGRNGMTRFETRYLRIPQGTSYQIDVKKDFSVFSGYQGSLSYHTSSRLFNVTGKGQITATRLGRGSVIVRGNANRVVQYIVDIYKPVKTVTPVIPEISLLTGQQYQLRYRLTPASASDVSVLYSSSNREVARVDSRGIIRAIAPGEAVITLSARDGYQGSGTVKVTVSEDNLKLPIYALPLKVGSQFQLQFDDIYDLSYYSSDESVATVTSTGLIRALSEGECYIGVHNSDYSSVTTIDIKNYESLAYGIDISNWNNTITARNWRQIKNFGIGFVIMRMGYGPDYQDRQYENNYQQCKDLDMPAGAYHYVTCLTKQQAIEEARFALTLLEGKKFEYPIVMDIEESEQRALDNETFNEIIEAYCSTLTEAGWKVAIYSNASMLRKLDAGNLARYDIWQAHWNTTEMGVFTKNTHIWQFTSSGTVPGITGRVDMNLSFFDYPDYMKANHLNGY